MPLDGRGNARAAGRRDPDRIPEKPGPPLCCRYPHTERAFERGRRLRSTGMTASTRMPSIRRLAREPPRKIAAIAAGRISTNPGDELRRPSRSKKSRRRLESHAVRCPGTGPPGWDKRHKAERTCVRFRALAGLGLTIRVGIESAFFVDSQESVASVPQGGDAGSETGRDATPPSSVATENAVPGVPRPAAASESASPSADRRAGPGP